MPFHAPGADEFGEKKKFPLAVPDLYRVRVDDYEIISGVKTEFNKDGNDRVRFYLTPLGIDGDDEAELVDTEDKPLADDKRFVFFFDPDHLGLKPQVSKSRKFLAAALGVPVEQPVNAKDLEEICDNLIGRELIVEVTIKGQYNNITDSRPVRKRARKRVEREQPLVEVASEVFKEDSPSTDEEDAY
jgi:hypothetical protein